MKANKILLFVIVIFIECSSPKKIESVHSKSFPNYYILTFSKKIKSISSIKVDSFKYVNTKIYQLDTLYKIESHRILKRDTQLLELMKSESKIYFYRIFINRQFDIYNGSCWVNDSTKVSISGRCGYHPLDDGKRAKKFDDEMQKFVERTKY
ncbi:MAG: hypothetical protein RL708_1046 [Bacteroidota bacterium]|jgi:hypothetical protein